jgi:hypothetical protein
VAEALVATARFAQQADRARQEALRRSLSLYLNRPVQELTPSGYAREAVTDTRVRFPIAKSVVDTVHAKLTKSLPRTTVLTEGATFTLRMQAEMLEDFIDGTKGARRNDWRALCPRIVRDAMVMRTGAVKVYPSVIMLDGEERGRICIDRVFAHELLVDPAEAVYGRPRSLFQLAVMDRRAAAESWPAHADAIERHARSPQRTDHGAEPTADQVCVWEGWHLASGHGADDGRHIIAVEGVDQPVVDEEYERDGFPFALLHWTDPLMGYWGGSLIDDIDGIHVEANEVAQRNQRRAEQLTPKLLTTSGEVEQSLDNDIDIAVYKVGPMEDVRLWDPPAFDPRLFDAFDRYVSYAQQMAGVSRMSVAGLKPAGLDSGVALREHQDIESERFASQLRAIEAFDMEVSRLIIDAARELSESGVPLTARTNRRDAMGQHYVESIRWSDIDLDDDAYVLQVWATSALPKTPAGRLAMVEQMVAAGFFGKEEAMRLLDFPDLDAVMSEQLAPVRLVLRTVDEIMYRGRIIPPIPEMDLALTRRIVNLAIQRFTMDEAPPARIEMLRRYAQQVDALMQRAEESAQSAGGGQFVPGAAGQMQPGLPQAAAAAGQAVV